MIEDTFEVVSPDDDQITGEDEDDEDREAPAYVYVL